MIDSMCALMKSGNVNTYVSGVRLKGESVFTLKMHVDALNMRIT